MITAASRWRWLDIALPCKCGGLPSVDDMRLGGQPGPFSVSCSSCYDGAPDAGHQKYACGTSLRDVLEDWNLQVEEEAMP